MKNTGLNIIYSLLILVLTSCMGDLNTLPKDDNMLTSEEVYKTAKGYKGLLAKCYASLVLTGQQGGDGGNGDVSGIDEGYSGYTRALFYLQEGGTDEMLVHSGGSHGTQAILFMNWDPSTKVVSYPYYRVYMTINYCNELLRESTVAKLKSRGVYEELKDDIEYYRAEARFLRAYSYSMICDLYGSGPFVDESSKLGGIPHQKTRLEIYHYALQELLAIEGLLHEPKANEYGRIDRVAAWFLLARMYLNQEVWIGESDYDKAYTYAMKVVNEGGYPLANDYREIFLADNNTCPEIIWPLVQDADNAQSSAGTNFILKALCNGIMDNYYKTGIGARGWGNVRVKTQLVNLFDEADQTFDVNDTWGDNKGDKRAQFFSVDHSKETWIDGKDFQKDFNNGYACIKWRNVTKDREELVKGGTQYSSIDYPLFRTADAYLMASEAILRMNGSKDEALKLINTVRDRAYLAGSFGSNTPNRVALSDLNLDFILDERARELHTELIRRTDLIRFNKYTKNNNWDWKGSTGMAGDYLGKDVDDKYNLFPIPQDEFTVNPNLVQNPDYD